MSEEAPETPIVIRKVRRGGHGHHGGAWKVAYADFVTAMMAFFLVMWLVGAGTREQRAAISEYFKNPSLTRGTATVAPPGRMGPGGASNSLIKLGGAMDLPRGPGKDKQGASAASAERKVSEKDARQLERARLDELMQQLQAAIQSSQALAPFKDQLLIDITPEGLRIQIVDKLNRPMFDSGQAQLKPYTQAILRELAAFINRVPNRIAISGHTDDAPYNDAHYSNWELSADRANAARRALLEGGLAEDKVARVVGLAASVPFDKTHPGDPINRRISIIVMTQQAEAASWAQETGGEDAGDKASPPANGAPSPPLMPTVTGAALQAPAAVNR
ncbi:flagellar motor protein MotB [Aerosticca soli]|uniref:Flagellar motor rotation protein MotB n=1 Tax=Aerosticca soli TaxID=2010829 RepID=A0A2Z6E6F5_9GAMM|nr:flagellar motor protein MotB [Aerosticca soli]BBD80069.1 flagellar motor rotation protein MotB [Aerosticca soli]